MLFELKQKKGSYVVYRSLFDIEEVLLTTGCADIGAAVVLFMALLITPATATRDITAISTRSAAGSVARSLTYRLSSYRKEGR